ncbi:MAG: hypothetical protein J6A22_02495 [Bacteroidales bacterium]|nr:hypothetical protein [Bacteroidales bacterium]
MKKNVLFLVTALMAVGSAAKAQETTKTDQAIDYIPDISLDTRFGYDHNFTDKAGSFLGDGLYLDINGYISPHFSYSLNHRLASSYYGDEITGFGATNWLTLSYERDAFCITAGKDALLVGSFEYDAYDLDSYYSMNSGFYNTLECWQWGVSATWYPAEDHSLAFQVANSPLAAGRPGMYAYNLAWRGTADFYESYWSLNLWEHSKGEFVKAINLGNSFTFGPFTLDYELMIRGDKWNGLDFSDFTTIIAPSVMIGDWGRAFAKIGYEKTADDLAYELSYGGEYTFYGAGFEYFPLKENQDVRLHAAWSSNNLDMHMLNIGLTWKFGITKTVKNILSKSGKNL